MGFFDFIGAIGTSISTFVSKALPVISSAINTLITKGPEIINRVASVIGDVLKVLGVLNPQDNMEEFGDKVMQAAEKGIMPDQFDNYDQYVEEIRNFELDPNTSAKISTEAKLVVAVGVGLNGLEKKMDMPGGSSGDLLRLVVLSPEYFNSDRLTHLLEKKVDFEKITDYLSGNLDLSDSRQVRSELFSAETSLDSTADESQHKQTLNNLKEQAREHGL